MLTIFNLISIFTVKFLTSQCCWVGQSSNYTTNFSWGVFYIKIVKDIYLRLIRLPLFYKLFLGTYARIQCLLRLQQLYLLM